MPSREEDELKFKMGRLIEGEEEDPLFSRRGKVSFTRFSVDTYRPVKIRWKNIKRGRPGTATYARRSGWTDYQDRQGRFSGKPDLLGIYGDDRTLFAAAVNATKDQARRYNDAVMLTGFFPVPKELSFAGQVAVMHFVCDDIRSSGRMCCSAMHDSRGDNRHFHIRATSRPLTSEGDGWSIGKGKFIGGPGEMAEWREKFCTFVNAQMDREGLPPETCRRFYPGPLSDLTGDRPAKRWVSARAFLRDDPDLSRPEDQFSIIWNACIDRGEDPNKDSFIIEQRAQWAKEREAGRAKRQAARAAKAARRKERVERLPEFRDLQAQIAQLRSLPRKEPLPPLSEDYRREVERTHKKNGTPLARDWQETEAKRTAAEAIRMDVVRRETEAKQKADIKAAKRAAAEAKALAKTEEEERARLQKIADEQARRELERAANATAKRAAKAAYDEDVRRHQEARRRQEIEATPKVVIPDARSIAAHVTTSKGALRAAKDNMAWEYGQASGKVGKSTHVAEFLRWQKDPSLQWIYKSTLAAAKQRGLHRDEADVLAFGQTHIEAEIKRRRYEPDSFLSVSFPAPAAPGGGQTPPSEAAPKESAPKKGIWPWSRSKPDRGR